MPQKFTEKPENKPEKIFTKCRKPDGSGILGNYIVAILLDAAEPLSVYQIHKAILNRYKRYYKLAPIYASIESIHRYVDAIQLTPHRFRAGDSRVTKITAQLKSTKYVRINDEPQDDSGHVIRPGD